MAEDRLILTGRDLTPEAIAAAARGELGVKIGKTARERLQQSRAIVEAALAADQPVYGLTTGLGARVTHKLSAEDLSEFSLRTVRGRSNATGPALPRDVVRAVMVVRLNGLVLGGSGVDPNLVDLLASMLEKDLLPVIPAIGSIGAGDLLLMAHVALAMIGEGEIDAGQGPRQAAEALREAGLEPGTLGPKDGLGLINASAVSAALAALAVAESEELLELAQLAAACSMEGFRANASPIDPRIAAARPQPGQGWAARGLRRLLAGGLLLEAGQARRLQDPISIRCTSQVHGALRAAIDFLRPAVSAEINGAADNPLVLIESGEVLSNGNFHTPLLALALDTLSQAIAQAAAVSLGRAGRLMIERLSGLPNNLSTLGAGFSGMAPLMKTGEALVAEIRHMAQPVSAEPRWASDGVEDEVTNAPLAGKKAREALWRWRHLLGIELLAAAQALDVAKPAKVAPPIKAAHAEVRAVSTILEEDRPLAFDLRRLVEKKLLTGQLATAARAAISG